MKYIVTINGKNYEVEVEKGQATIVKTTAAPVVQAAPVAAAPVAVAPQPQAPAAPVSSNVTGEAIKAPMPGTIINVKVSSGASVKKGDTLLILEAMKMENEISAPRDGVVAEILVAKGTSVSTGDVLLALK